MSRDVTPVIRRDWSKDDSEAAVLGTVMDDTTFERGLGPRGKTVEWTNMACPCCDHHRTIRSVRVNPDRRNNVAYWCLNPQCRYFVSGELSWATRNHPGYEPETPEVWDHTHVCTECEARESIEITRASFQAKKTNGDGVIEHVCESCEAEIMGVSGGEA